MAELQGNKSRLPEPRQVRDGSARVRLEHFVRIQSWPGGTCQDQLTQLTKLSSCFLYPFYPHKLLTSGRPRQEIDILQNNLDFLSQRIETNEAVAAAAATAAAVSNQDNQYQASTNAANANYQNEYASPSADYTGYANYPSDQQASADTAAVAQNYSSPSPNQSANVARDDVNYEGTVH